MGFCPAWRLRGGAGLTPNSSNRRGRREQQREKRKEKIGKRLFGRHRRRLVTRTLHSSFSMLSFSSLAIVLQTVDFFARRADSQRSRLRPRFAARRSSTGCSLLVTEYRLLTTLAAAEGRAKCSAVNYPSYGVSNSNSWDCSRPLASSTLSTARVVPVLLTWSARGKYWMR